MELPDVHDIKCMEHSTLKVPYEVLNKKYRAAQKIIDRESAYTLQAAMELEKSCSGRSYEPVGTMSGSLRRTDSNRSKMSLDEEEISSAEPQKPDESGTTSKDQKPRRPSKKDVFKLLDVIADRLSTLKRKAGESIAEELDSVREVRKRVQHLKDYASNPADSAEWKKNRMNRMLVDHLLREGMYDSARLLAEELDLKNVTNVETFWAAKEVEESLKRHETSRIVAWCYENKSKLRKVRSTLELEVRVQEFVELVRRGHRFEAVTHARKYLAESEDTEHITAVKKCMGLLAFPISVSAIHPYYELLSEDRWQNLISHFRAEHVRVYQLAPTSVLGTVVQAGLAALKTPQCYVPSAKNANCPVCSEPLSTLATVLPFAHGAHSSLICPMSGECLNENNPPMVLPSGFVYGSNSLKQMAAEKGGKVECPRSGRTFFHHEAEKVYVM